MPELSPDLKQTRWRSARRMVLAVLRWTPELSPEAYRLVKRGAVCAFAVDVGLLLAVHYGWLDRRWSTLRQWEDAGAMFLMILWMTQAIERRRKKRTAFPPPEPPSARPRM